MAGEPQFAAFLSYSRKDVRLARWLVRSLEEFRLPRQTVEDLKARRASFIAARPIFRDEHDMPVGGVISDRLSEVLDASATMIVLCTTSSVKSEWVNREIELYASRHPGRRIIPAVAEGEPDSDASYPPALLKLGKPLAADIRNPAERRQSVIKIAAAVLGLDVDQLVGRVRKRQAEQRRWLAVGSAAAAAVVIGLSVTAGVMANSAKRANDRAYEQVAELLINTRTNMDDLAAKKALHEAAKLYFDSKAGQRHSDRDMLLRAEWLRQEGEDSGKRREDEISLAYRQEALATTTELLRREPENPEFLFSHGQSAYWMGYYYFERGRPDEARPFLEKYSEAARRLFEVEPDYTNKAHDTDARSEVYYAQVNLGMLALEKKRDPRVAAKAFSEALLVLNSNPETLKAKLNLSRSHLQYVEALAQFAPASEVRAAVQIWEPLLLELERSSLEDEVEFHLVNSWDIVTAVEKNSADFVPGDADKNKLRSPNRDPENVVSLTLAAELELQTSDTPNCKSLPRLEDFKVTDRSQLRRVQECLTRLPASHRAARCSAFTAALAPQNTQLGLEPLWARLLVACSKSAIGLEDTRLYDTLRDAAAQRFFSRRFEEMRLWTQLALSGFPTVERNPWITELNTSLNNRGWITKGEK